MEHAPTLQRSLLIALFTLILLRTAPAQNITGYRYWFNDDNATMVQVATAPTPLLSTTVQLNSSSLPVGLHTATIQFHDADGHYTAPYTSTFAQHGSTVQALEYWFNDSANDAVQIAATPAADFDLSVALDAGALPTGFHTVTVRSLDARGEWSVPYTTTFIRSGGNITGYEYWIDDQIQDRVMNSIGPAMTVDLVEELPLNTTDGDHTFTIRFHDETEGWSVPLSTTFSFATGINEIAGVSNYLLFPNPVGDGVTLRLDATERKDLQVSLLDATGRVVMAPTNWTVLGLSHHRWDTSALSNGSYLVRITSGDHTFHIPFIKS